VIFFLKKRDILASESTIFHIAFIHASSVHIVLVLSFMDIALRHIYSMLQWCGQAISLIDQWVAFVLFVYVLCVDILLV
jgi:hypothetical protein